jgi:hypothetical protein
MVAPDAYLHYYKSQMIKVWVSLCISCFSLFVTVLYLERATGSLVTGYQGQDGSQSSYSDVDTLQLKKRVVVDSFESIAEIPLPAGIIRFRMVNMRTNIKRWGVESAGSLWRVIDKIIQSNYRHE